MDEVKYKLLGDTQYDNSKYDIIRNIKKLNDDNLKYLIELYIIYKLDLKKVRIKFISFHESKFFFAYEYYNNGNWYSDLFSVDNSNEFIEFINNPNVFKETQKYNL